MNKVEIIVVITTTSIGFLVLIMLGLCIVNRLKLRRAQQERQQRQEQIRINNWNNQVFDLPEEHERYGFDPEIDLEYGDKCQICHDIMDGKSTIGKLHPCKHAFHKNCIYQWFQTQYNQTNSYKCPICRDECPPSIICAKIVPLSRNR
mgnify:CR=1 FL=1